LPQADSKKIAEIEYHPRFRNLLIVAQDSGDVHLVDTTNGSIVAEYVAKLKNNPNWAMNIKDE
jgi:hypothetical protein